MSVGNSGPSAEVNVALLALGKGGGRFYLWVWFALSFSQSNKAQIQ